MLVLPGQSPRNCERLSRRDWLCIGGLGCLANLAGSASLPSGQTFGAPADDVARHHAPGFGRAKRCIVLFLFGGPAHQDSFDLKPDAPREVRGEFVPIASKVPDITISEHLPLLAERTDKFAQIRSVTHPDNTHTVAMHYMLTGVRHKRPATNPQNAADDFPCFGAVTNYLRTRKRDDGGSPLPAGISLNSPANQVSANNHIFPGFFAGSLGAGYDPLFVSQSPENADFTPFSAIDTPQRLLGRRDLQRTLDPSADTVTAQDVERAYDQAFGLLTSPQVHRAFDMAREPAALRERFGYTPFGQGCLLARRLAEAGVSLITVNWQRDDAYWDTHSDNFNLHKNKLLPNFDRGFSALLDDLSDRGMLDETLVVVLSEFGRTPKINSAAGRDHWAPCNTVLLSGGGIPGGLVYGASDRIAAYPARNPVLPEDLAATIYHLLGIDPETPIPAPDGRRQVVSTGEVITGLL